MIKVRGKQTHRSILKCSLTFASHLGIFTVLSSSWPLQVALSAPKCPSMTTFQPATRPERASLKKPILCQLVVEGQAEAICDRIVLEFLIQSESPNLQANVASSREAATYFIRDITQKLQINSEKISEHPVETSKKWDRNYSKGQGMDNPSLPVYVTQLRVTIEVMPFALIEPLLQLAAEHGITQMYCTKMETNNPALHQGKARAAALKEATAQAEQIASNMNLQVVGIKCMNFPTGRRQMPVMSRASAETMRNLEGDLSNRSIQADLESSVRQPPKVQFLEAVEIVFSLGEKGLAEIAKPIDDKHAQPE